MSVRKIVACLVAASFFAVTPSHAFFGGGGGGGDATLGMQITQQSELVAIYAKEAEQAMTQLNQYMTMLQNLQQLPAAVLQQALGVGVGELAGQMQQYLSLYQSVSRLRGSAQQVADTLAFHERARSSLDMSADDYFNTLLALSRSGHSYYQRMHQDALTGMQSLERDAGDVQRLAATIPNVTGNIQGLQTLAAVQTQVARQLVGVQAALQQGNAATAMEGEEARKREEISKARMKAWAAEIQGMPRLGGGR